MKLYKSLLCFLFIAFCHSAQALPDCSNPNSKAALSWCTNEDIQANKDLHTNDIKSDKNYNTWLENTLEHCNVATNIEQCLINASNERYSLPSYKTCKNKEESKAADIACKDYEIRTLINNLDYLTNDDSDQKVAWSNDLFKRCNTTADINACLVNAYTKKIAELNSEITAIRNATPGTPSETKTLISKFAGIYSHRHNDGSDPREFVSDTLEFVSISDSKAYVKASRTYSPSEAECEIAGVAEYKKDGKFLLQYAVKDLPFIPSCLLTLNIKDNTITLDDFHNNCAASSGEKHCFNNMSFNLSQKKKISDMSTILNSSEYQNALQNYHDNNPNETKPTKSVIKISGA